MSVTILQGDCRAMLPTLPAQSVNCIVTSPPYFGLRDYGVETQIGLEPSPSEFVEQLVIVFREARRVLRDDGTLWLNLGDSYAGSWGAQGHRITDSDDPSWHSSQIKNHPKRGKQTGTIREAGLKPKDLIGIPWRVAFALQADGWFLRQDIIWSKPNPMPESVTDRCTKAHEYLFLLSKSPRYYFDAAAIAEPLAAASVSRLAQNLDGQSGSDRVPGKTNGRMKAVAKGNRKTFRGGGVYTQGQSFDNDASVSNDSVGNEPDERGLRNKRTVWTVATQPFKEAHFATFPPELIEPCILAGCPKGGTVLDPFGGAGTTGLVADRLQRDAVLIELNPAYAEMARKRIAADAGLFGAVA
ncbi:site-specific DNA-methyltransferase [Mesorhizobium sp.]|uniref:DNA-methyltransferase n=1 Tax=Mesorhizobium sp. TaxID=1871066 RepID=UPI000FE51DCC|nr:site-specific DNA-methyltransferase [Mesorhizobium sp.]RWO90902.1 MAG: site-specific DNA-methyltransferase [Mesorhizobium sp.]